ncbi:MAG: hypothetical protein NZ528_07100 [Caldilineales bacterium]|nr:hypothetical protein [Caldilineales bacterium]MCX7669711.1 hypothetical protein [Anaerolineae bacterium]
MHETRTSDLAILLGHALQCEACRERLLTAPDRVLVGRKISAEQRSQVAALRNEDFESAAALAAAVGLSLPELVEGQNHPRARLRHL